MLDLIFRNLNTRTDLIIFWFIFGLWLLTFALLDGKPKHRWYYLSAVLLIPICLITGLSAIESWTQWGVHAWYYIHIKETGLHPYLIDWPVSCFVIIMTVMNIYYIRQHWGSLIRKSPRPEKEHTT